MSTAEEVLNGLYSDLEILRDHLTNINGRRTLRGGLLKSLGDEELSSYVFQRWWNKVVLDGGSTSQDVEAEEERGDDRLELFKELFESANLDYTGTALPSGSAKATLHAILAWSPGRSTPAILGSSPDSLGRAITPDSVLTTAFSTTAKIIAKGINPQNDKIYVRDTSEPRMKFVDWTSLPRWSSRMATARSCLPPTATQEQQSALATCLEIGFQLGLDVLRDRSRPLLTVSQGRYTHLALLEQLGHLPTELRVIPISIEVPTPGLPSLSIEEGVVEVEGRAVLSDGEIRQVHLLIGHGSMNSFASPQDEARFKMAIGMDFAINLLVKTCGARVPADKVDMYSRSNLPTKEGLDTFVGCYAFTASKQVERVSGRLASTSSAKVPVQVMEWIKSRGLDHMPDDDAKDSRPYLSRIWAAHQALLKQEKTPAEATVASKRSAATLKADTKGHADWKKKKAMSSEADDHRCQVCKINRGILNE